MILDFGEFTEIIRPVKDPLTKKWEIQLDYITTIPLYAGKGQWHLPWNGARFYGMILHKEPYKTREEMVLELIMSNIHIQKQKPTQIKQQHSKTLPKKALLRC